jgi:hypothetical protein
MTTDWSFYRAAGDPGESAIACREEARRQAKINDTVRKLAWEAWEAENGAPAYPENWPQWGDLDGYEAKFRREAELGRL